MKWALSTSEWDMDSSEKICQQYIHTIVINVLEKYVHSKKLCGAVGGQVPLESYHNI
jgi:hypothetical protein